MGLVASIALPAPKPTYSFASLGSPPLYAIDGVPCLCFMPSRPQAVMVYCHGNGADLGTVQGICSTLATNVNAVVLAVEYPGYGALSHQSRSLKGCIDSAGRVAAYARRHIGHLPLFLIGRSIGSGVVAQLARRLTRQGRSPAGVILISPFASLRRVGEAYVGALLTEMFIGNTYDSETALKTVDCATLIIHGTHDELFDLSHAHALAKASADHTARVHVMEGGTHNVLEWSIVYETIRKHVGQVVGARPAGSGGRG